MILSQKLTDDKMGHSQGASPAANVSDDSMDTSDSESDSGMKVGDDYQAIIPDYNPDVKADARAEAMLVWAPSPELTEAKTDEYVLIAKDVHHYNMEQALGMLFWHKHNIERALSDLANFTPFPDEWTVEDKVLFEQAFSFHGKCFQRIRHMLPDKTIAHLVKYYYSWKKTRSRTSLMDRQARKITAKDEYSDDESEHEEETEQKDAKTETVATKTRPGPASKKYELHPRKNKHKKKPPRGMHINQDDLLAFSTGPVGQGDALLKQLDSEIVSLRRNIQNNRQHLANLRASSVGGIDTYRPPATSHKINARFSNDETQLVVLAIRLYGRNFRAIAQLLNNKTEAHIRSFFVNQRKRLNLDDVLASHHQEQGTTPPTNGKDAEVIDLDPEEKMETEDGEQGESKPVKATENNANGDDEQETSTPEETSSKSSPTCISKNTKTATPNSKTSSKEQTSHASSEKESQQTNGETTDK